MHTRFASVVPGNADRATQVIRTWHANANAGILDQLLSGLVPQSMGPTRLVASIDGSPVALTPSGFERDGIVLVFHRTPGQALRVVFFDLGSNSFWPAVATLSMTDRAALGGNRRRRNEFLQSLFTAALDNVPARRPVGV